MNGLVPINVTPIEATAMTAAITDAEQSGEQLPEGHQARALFALIERRREPRTEARPARSRW